ncbi:uncharacterized protein AB9X84_022949 isoform 1-T1 [Acanthopagrus schlegelii]
MNVLLSLSLSLALMMSSCGGLTAENHEEETTTAFYDYSAETTPDYDYNATFDYYFVTEQPTNINEAEDETGINESAVKNQAAGVGPLSPVLLLGLVVHQIWT